MKRVPLAADVLTVDIGNSKVAAVRFAPGRVRRRFRIDTRGLDSTRLAREWRRVQAAARLGRDTPVVVASVVPARTAQLVRILRARHRGAVHVARWDDPWPFESRLRQPQRVGVDRLANLAGLCALGHRSGVVVDVGTAITIDVLRAMRFEGGLIVPGFDLQLAALHRHTALLPLLTLDAEPPLVGRDTASAMRAGVWHTTTAGVAAVARELRAALPRRAPIVATGGGAAAIALALGDPGCELPDLQMTGLRLLATRLRSPVRGPK
jgi:type III pantothenate kinase